jgi:hypothetical protein
MKIMCAIDRTPCGDGASGPCLAQHPDKCVCKYIETAKPRKPKKVKREEYYEEEVEEWKL